MSLFGSLFTGVSGLAAQSQATSMIANNIANVNTVGFKRSEAAFFSLVTTESRSSRYSPGTVSVDRIQRVDQQGPIQQSVSSTDVSISGNGFFAVKRDNLNSSLTEYLYTRNGQFSEDSQGFLRNTAGFYLYGWPLDTNGNLPSNQGDLTSLVPIDVAFLGGLTRATTDAELALNLDSNQVDTDLASAPTAPVNFTRSLTVYDSLGNGQAMSFEFVKTYGPQATAASIITSNTSTTDLVTDLGLTAGDQFTLSVDGAVSRTYDVAAVAAPPGDVVVTTLGDIINDINNNVAGASAFLGNDGELVIQRDDFLGGAAQTIQLDDVTGTAVSGLGLTPAVAFASDDLDSANYDNGSPTDAPPYSSEGFPTFQNLPGDATYNPRGWWQVVIRDPNSNVISQGLMNFDQDGSTNAIQDSDGNIDIELSNINWGNGSALQNINVDVSRFTQFSGAYTVLFADQNGAELGLRTGVDIDRDGFVIARFSNGATSKLYKLPLVTFANANGLQEISGTAYTETEESGEENLREAGRGGAGYMEPSTLEVSNVDLADEFAKLIITQRAYSANTRVINTVDQMTEDLLRLR